MRLNAARIYAEVFGGRVEWIDRVNELPAQGRRGGSSSATKPSCNDQIPQL
jgi:hypothetical protein